MRKHSPCNAEEAEDAHAKAGEFLFGWLHHKCCGLSTLCGFSVSFLFEILILNVKTSFESNEDRHKFFLQKNVEKRCPFTA